MRSKRHVSASLARQQLLLCGCPVDGAVQVVDTINAGQGQGLTKASQGLTPAPRQDICTTATGQDISVVWVLDATGQLQPYQVLPGICPDSSACVNTSDTDAALWLLQQLMQAQQQQQAKQQEQEQDGSHCKKRQQQQHQQQLRDSSAQEQQANQQQGLGLAPQHSHSNVLSPLVAVAPQQQQQEEGFQCVDSHQQLATSLAAAAAAAQAAAQQRCCKDCGATVSLSWHWYRSSGSRNSSRHCRKGSSRDNYSSIQQCYALCHICSAHLRSTGRHRRFKVAPTVSAGPAAIAAALAAAAAASAAAGSAEGELDSHSKRQVGHATVALAAAEQQSCLNSSRSAPSAAEQQGDDNSSRFPPEPAVLLGASSCSNCSRITPLADCCRQLCNDPLATSQQQQRQQQQVLCAACEIYQYIAGVARPVAAAEQVANQAAARQLAAAWQGLQQWQQQQKHQQQQDRVRVAGVKRPRSDTATAATGARKREALVSKPEARQKQQKQRQQQASRTPAVPLSGPSNGIALAATGADGGTSTAKPSAPAAHKAADGAKVSNKLKRLKSKQPPKFKELKRNVYVHRQRVQLDSRDVVVCSCQPILGQCCSAEDECLNHLCKVSCTPGHCPAGDDVCRNMVLVKQQFPCTKLVDLGPKGWGMVAAEDIKAGTTVAEYTGEVIPVSEGKKRLAQYAAEGLKHTYIMDLSKSEVIDATKKGGMARFINHSCEPNCKTVKWQVGGEVVVAIKATQHIPEGTEVTYDYRYQSHDLPHARTRCCCGSASCTGWLGTFDPHEHLQAELDEDEIREAERLAMGWGLGAVGSEQDISE